MRDENFLPKPFTNKIGETVEDSTFEHYLLWRNSDIIRIDKLIDYDKSNDFGCVPCNVLAEKDSKSKKDFVFIDKDLSIEGKNLRLPSFYFAREDDSMGGGKYEGIYLNDNYSSESSDFDIEFQNTQIGKSDGTIVQKNATEIEMGESNEELIDKDGRLVWGTTINIFNNTVEFPDWDRYMDVDTFLSNAYGTDEDNQYGLETKKHEEVCYKRAQAHSFKTQKDCHNCMVNAGVYVQDHSAGNYQGYGIYDQSAQKYILDYNCACHDKGVSGEFPVDKMGQEAKIKWLSAGLEKVPVEVVKSALSVGCFYELSTNFKFF